MPFIGRDWRSPGEAWVKTETLGWQRMKIIESQLYPSRHQIHACSWPQRSDFGHHMAKHCKQHEQQGNGDFRNNSVSSAGSSGSSDSEQSSRGGSTSPSPSSSPEKGIHHLYPITVSSAYGQFSCCVHHLESGQLPMLNLKRTTIEGANGLTAQATTMSRSLSRESLPIGNETDTMGCRSQKLRYNNSVSDFRNSSSDEQRRYNQSSCNHETQTSPEKQDKLELNSQESEQNDSPKSMPILMKNGRKMEDGEFYCSDQQQQHRQADVDQATRDTSKSREQSSSRTMETFDNCCCCFNSCSSQNVCQQSSKLQTRTAPHCRISVKTREVAMYNTISEAFYRLDFCNAIHDIRRFNYICKLLHLLITQNLTSLSGCATKVLFTMLEQVAWEVSSNKRNIHVLKNLLIELRQMIQKYYCWGRPIGSSLLWQQHFDTIERISQMVDRIELSPPKNDNAQTTFNNLPVEMIREILLRLSDYRDLINSAQASPVMRTMIDGQYIWQQLCRYHFTEQQLKMAIENYNGLLMKKTGNTTLRGIKYAKTTSADGKTSFRNPVKHKSKNQPASSTANDTGAKVAASTSRQQSLDETSSRRCVGSRSQATSISSELDDNDESQLPATSSPNSSYVTRAIRIFDKRSGTGSKTTMKTSGANDSQRQQQQRQGHELERRRQSTNNAPLAASGSHQNLKHTANKGHKSSNTQQQSSSRVNSSRANHDIDWERVFHHLRKKFDLKEEYADCLLLCRHCRCLFWKSFGHPCIKSEESSSPNDASQRSGLRLNNGCSLIGQASDANSARAYAFDGFPSNRADRASSHNGELNQIPQNRPSVAALSRNFDNRALRSSNRADDVENVPPPSSASPPNNSSSNSNNNVLVANINEQRMLNDNLNAQLREHNMRSASRRLNEGNSNNAHNSSNAPVAGRPSTALRRDELVPKHVAISPQAFLKFFSL